MIDRRIFCTCAGLFCTGSFWSRRATAAASQPNAEWNLPKEIAGISIPDSRLARSAILIARAEMPAFLLNHCIRTFVFGALAANRMGRRYDAELAFAAAALHDLGLLEKNEKPGKTFEAVGADIARDHVKSILGADDKAEIVRQAIALHTTTGARSATTEVAMIQIGAGMDVFGFDILKDLPANDVAAIVAELPRAAFNKEFKKLLVAHGKRKPGQAGEHNWIAPFVKAADAREGLALAFDESPWPE